ncbi:hypothetical protein JNB71_07945 [Rhizobium herbae]|uniref:Porin n=1 Tax=Rhizobium herbae TaxID=508661 RepID=A0ABS7H7M4_9HYPH|nr:hypothetical protein [Rhizobium herbae]MBW9063247.1 hypothetical protein [Rhizobium herbae]
MKALRTVTFSLVLWAASMPFGATVSADPFRQPVQAYTDLPGVKTPEAVEQENAVSCQQVRIRRSPGLNSGYATANFCRRGNGPVFQSGRLPPSIIRQLRGFTY